MKHMTTAQMMTLKLTYHTRVERRQRIISCLSRLGLGEIILEVADYTHNNNCVRCLTSTGLIFIIDLNSHELITGYMANIRQVASMYYAIGISRIPDNVFNTVKYNEYYFSDLYVA